MEAVFHLARGGGSRWQDYLVSDVQPTEALARAALLAGVRRFVFTGTIDSYYSGDSSQTIGCDTPLDPKVHQRNHYARSKAACEQLLLQLHRDQGLPVVILRPGIVIGAGCSPAHWGVGMFLSPTSMHYWGNGANALPLVLVEDVASALHAALDAPRIEGECFLVTDAPLMTAQDYVAEMSRAMQTRIRAKKMPIWRLFAQDLVKEAVKHAVRHPNRRRPSLRDWASRQHLPRYEAARTRQALSWQPASDKTLLIERGIVGPVAELLA